MTQTTSFGAAERGPRLDPEQARLALEAGRMGAWRWTMATGEVVWDETLEALYGLPPGGFDGRYETYLSLIHPDDRETSVRTIASSIDGGGQHRVEHRVVWPDGSVHWIEGWGRVTRDAGGQVDGIIGVAVDISERKQSEQRLREQDAWIRRLQGITASISGAVSVAEIADVVIEHGVAATGADAGVLALVAGEALEIVGDSGFRPGGLDRWRRQPLDAALPLAAVSRTGTPIWGESAAALAERLPSFRDASDDVGFGLMGAVVAVPLVANTTPIGAIGLRFLREIVVSLDEQEFLLALAGQAAQAFDRARLYELERGRVGAEREARAGAEAARMRLQQLQAITEAGLAHVSLDDALERMLAALRGAIGADSAAILLADEGRGLLTVRAALGVEGRGSRSAHTPIDDPVLGRAALHGESIVIDDAAETVVAPHVAGELGSLAVVPMRVSGHILGVLHAGSRSVRPFTLEDLELLHLAAERVALAVDRAQLFEREHRIAETLQRSLLPERLPELPGVQLAARYLPGSAEVQVGGDWYEVVPLTGGRLSAAVGDVVGRGIRAAAAMGQFRNAMRALALEGLSPARLLDRMSELSIGLGREFATAMTLEFDPSTGVVAYSSAGHPPALVLPPEGEPWFLDGGRSTPLGVEPGMAYPEAVAQLAPGTTLLVYTDGLIERRGETLGDGLARLRAVAAGEPDPERLVDVVLEALTGEHRDDDVALLAIRYVMAPSRFELRLPSEPRSVSRFRSETKTWLQELGASSSDVDDVVLAVSEACSNAVEHARVEDGEVVLAAELRDADVVMTVQDAGRWQPPHLRFERGRGFRILRALMDDVQVSRRGDGTEVRMRRRLGDRVPAG